MKKMKYIGCFLNKDELAERAALQRAEGLAKQIEHPHVTFFYHPETVPAAQFGKAVMLRVVGYGCDGENEAFSVIFEDLPKGLAELASAIERPHITLSVSETGKAVNSRDLTFRPITPFLLTGVFGGMDFDGTVHTSKCHV